MNNKKQLDLLLQMLRIRGIEQRLIELYPDQEMRCPVHFCVGQEAIAVGVCGALSQGDYMVSGHRSHGHYLAKGGNLNRMIAEIYGRETGCSVGNGGSMHLVDLDVDYLGSSPIVGGTIPIGVGAALSSAMKSEGRVSVVFLGDGAVETGVFYESVNFAVLKNLPVLFVCENNLYSVYTPLSDRQPEGREIFEMVRGMGASTAQGDGNNVEEIFHMTSEAIGSIRSDGGPQFLEFKTYRWYEHVGPNFDNYIGYRDKNEYQEWLRRCPIAIYSAKLVGLNQVTEAEISHQKEQVLSEVNSAIEQAKQAGYKSLKDLDQLVFAS
jgi:pyruvate dehydrogenase E1 component alpha subunit